MSIEAHAIFLNRLLDSEDYFRLHSRHADRITGQNGKANAERRSPLAHQRTADSMRTTSKSSLGDKSGYAANEKKKLRPRREGDRITRR
jgi:hypothetical protein